MSGKTIYCKSCEAVIGRYWYSDETGWCIHVDAVQDGDEWTCCACLNGMRDEKEREKHVDENHRG